MKKHSAKKDQEVSPDWHVLANSPELLDGVSVDQRTESTIYDFLSTLDCPRSLAIWLCFKYDHDSLRAFDINPLDYNHPDSFRDAYIASEFLSKYPHLDKKVKTDEVAYQTFLECEDKCRESNKRLKNMNLLANASVTSLSAISRKIDRILGPLLLQEVVTESQWGPRATVYCSMSTVPSFSPAYKYAFDYSISHSLYSLIGEFFHTISPMWAESYERQRLNHPELQATKGFMVVPGNRVSFIPKNSKTDRSIAIEPGINMYFQKGIGNVIAKRLKRHGVDLRKKNPGLNQRSAMLGSITTTLATVDLRSASGTISSELVKQVLPPEWFDLMDSVRSKYGTVTEPSSSVSRTFKYEQFSSMGNGFTFELESLIFLAAAQSVCSDKENEYVTVFGDDIIIPTHRVPALEQLFALLGFEMNTKKTHWKTPFRESCGEHYFDGVDCKPIYLKDKLYNAKDIFKLANGIRFLSHRHCFYNGCDVRYRSTWRHLVKRLPKALRLGIPFGYGDGGLHQNFDEALPTIRTNTYRGFESQYHFKMLVDTPESINCSAYELLFELVRDRKQSLGNDTEESAYSYQQANSFSRLTETIDQVAKLEQVDSNTRTTSRLVAGSVVEWYDMGAWRLRKR